MTFRLLVLLAMLLLSVGFPGLLHAGDAEDSPPNVVMIISDDQAWTDYGFTGHPHLETPNLDRLAEQSRTFTRGHVPSALCRPALATMITGLHAHQHGITGNDPRPDRPPELRRRLLKKIQRVPTLPEILNDEHGYLSHQSGKWWEGHYSRGGFTHGMTQGFGNHPRGRHGDEGLKIGREGMGPVFDFMDEAQERDRPFFVWYAPFLPHRPHNPPDQLLEKYKDKTESIHVARYWAMCEWFDETVGELMGYLDENGLAEDTLVLFVVDNGWIQQRDSGGYAPRSKRSVYDGGVRTPIMVRWPGVVEPEMDRETVVSSVDLAPTVLDAAGLEPSEEMPGVSLLDEEAVEDREAIFGAAYAVTRVDLDDPAATRQYRWCIRDNWKLLVREHGDLGSYSHLFEWDAVSLRLYNLADDPHETANLAEERPEQVEALRERLDRWLPPKSSDE
jgi:uncharacterized sulfatase